MGVTALGPIALPDGPFEALLSRGHDDPRWDEFVESVPDGELLQTTSWGRVKSPGFDSLRLVISEDGEIVGGAQLLIKRVRYVGLVAYVPKGPVIAPDRPEVLDHAIAGLRALPRQLGLRTLFVQPAAGGAVAEQALITAGFQQAVVDVAPSATVEISLQPPLDQLWADLRQNRRRNIRRAEGRGVRVREAGADELATFHALHVETATRQGFEPMTFEYMDRQWAALHGHGRLKVFLAEDERVPISGIMVSAFGDRVTYKLAGWHASDETRSIRPNELLHWHAIQSARQSGYRFYDFGGLDRAIAEALCSGRELSPEQKQHPSAFKLGFGGSPRVLPIAYQLLTPAVVNTAFKITLPLFRGRPAVDRYLNRQRSV